ncbi:MAG: response regulator [Paenibacillaceae bacterium]|nr:response regulator [Paenibacillaceae bacterium]
MVLNMNLNFSTRDGFDVVSEILSIKSLPIIVLTSLDDPEVIVDAVIAGAVNYFTKPIIWT